MLDSLNANAKSYEKLMLEVLKKISRQLGIMNDENLNDILATGEAEERQATRRKENLRLENEIRKEYLLQYYTERAKLLNKDYQAMSAEEKNAFESSCKTEAERFANRQTMLKRITQLEAEQADQIAKLKNKHEEDFIKYQQSAKNRQILYEMELNDRYSKYRSDNLQKALEEEAARRGKTVEELTESEIAHAKKVADNREMSEEKFKKLQKKSDSDKNKKKQGPRKVEFEKFEKGKNPLTVGFKNAFTGTVGLAKGVLGATGDAIKETASKYVKRDPDGNLNISGAFNALAGFAEQLDGKIKEAAGHQSKIDTRLYGSTSNDQALGSYWKAMSGSIMAIAGASPLFLQTDMISSLEKLVESGISHNLKLRAFLDATADKIAATFEVSDSTMLRLIRLQQQDSTAARMGMESALNAFLNNMFETTEYLSKVADTVRGNLEEAQALMGAKQATEFEYQVQKWLGSFYSVGMSDQAVTNISTTIGQLAAGQIEALSGSGTGNLMIMAANAAGISIADILKDGLDSKTTNKLLEATVEYLAQIAKQSDSKVVQQQLAGVFGMKASDLQSIMNLANDNSKTIKNIANNNLTNEGMMLELAVRAATMSSRVDMNTMMNNLWENVQYSMAASIANNPATFALYKMAGLLQDAVGGIPISFLNVYGFGVNLETSVANLMKVGALAGGIMTSLPQMIAGVATAAGGGAAMLAAAGIGSQAKTINRGNGGGAAGAMALSGLSSSSSGLVGNGSSEDMTGATMASGQDDKDSQGQQGKEENEDATRDDIIEILKMLFGGIGDKLDENTDAIKGIGGVFNSNSTTGGFTNAATTKNSF
jgi:hypothetical protein